MNPQVFKNSITPGKVLPFLLSIAVAAGILSCKGRTMPAEGSQTAVTATPPSPPDPFSVINGDTVWFRVDVLPVFKGGSDALFRFISESFSYPEAAREKRVQGRVVVGFVLTTDSRITDAKIVTGIDPDCDREALRVVNSLPRFEKPALVKGRPVAFHFTLPVHFELN